MVGGVAVQNWLTGIQPEVEGDQKWTTMAAVDALGIGIAIRAGLTNAT